MLFFLSCEFCENHQEFCLHSILFLIYVYHHENSTNLKFRLTVIFFQFKRRTETLNVNSIKRFLEYKDLLAECQIYLYWG